MIHLDPEFQSCGKKKNKNDFILRARILRSLGFYLELQYARAAEKLSLRCGG